jgi:hypothetical protein
MAYDGFMGINSWFIWGLMAYISCIPLNSMVDINERTKHRIFTTTINITIIDVS